MKDFIVYLQPTGRWRQAKKIVTLEELKGLPGSGKLDELKVVKDGKLTFVHEFNGTRLFRFSCDYQAPKSVSGIGQPPLQHLIFELLQRKDGLVVSIQAPKKPSRIAVAALSYSTFGDPFIISPLRLSKLEFRKLIEVVEKHSGKLNRFSLRWIRGKKGVIRKFEVSGDFNEILDIDINNILESAKKISYMGFIIPSVEESTFSFRITAWGGGQIYQPSDPQLNEVSNLIGLFEEAFLT